MICFEAFTETQVHAACAANVVGLSAVEWSVTAVLAISLLRDYQRAVVHCQCSSCRVEGAVAAWGLIGRQLCEKLVHQLLTVGELTRAMLPNRPELEGVEDAHVQQPPRQARPCATRLPSVEVCVVQLRQHIHRAGVIEVITHRARAADGNLLASLVPAIERGSLGGRAVVAEHPQWLPIAPHRHCRVALLPLDPLTAIERTDVCRMDGGHFLPIATHGAAEADASLCQRVQEPRRSEPVVTVEDALLMLIGCGHAQSSVDSGAGIARSHLFACIHLEVEEIVLTRQAPYLVAPLVRLRRDVLLDRRTSLVCHHRLIERQMLRRSGMRCKGCIQLLSESAHMW